METRNRTNSVKDEYYLNIAEQVAQKSTCIRRNFGAVIVKKDQIIATGFGGVPRGVPHCDDIGYCFRTTLGARKGEHYEYCRSVHAEQNAMIQASRLNMLEAVLYLVGVDAKTKEPLDDTEPCRICKRMIANAGIKSVIARQGNGRKEIFFVEEWKNNYFWELKKKKGKLIPVHPPRVLSDPADEELAKQLISSFSLRDAIVVQTLSYEHAKVAVGRIAARFFISNIRSGDSVSLSCGDTILSMLQFLPTQPQLRLKICQLSIEGDPTMIHQAPSTLVGLLRSKCSTRSRVYGLQLPPLKLAKSSQYLREELVETEFLAKLKNEAKNTDYIFIGLGSAKYDSASFWAMAQSATMNKFSQYVKKLGIVGEINNQVFDKSGNNLSDKIPCFEKYVVNILSLEDLREVANKSENHKVVMLATGDTKIKGMRAALESGFANILITCKQDAVQLLS